MAPVRLVIFDLDETLIDSRKAWAYTVEQAVLAVSGRHVDASALVNEYRRRPWRHVFSVVANDPTEAGRCEETANEMFYRSGLKRLLVHDGVGMALDGLRAMRLEIGAISREPHRRAIKQIESTGLDRFLSVLSPTPDGDPWDVAARLAECISYLARQPQEAVYVSGESGCQQTAFNAGVRALDVVWAAVDERTGTGIATPAELQAAIRLIAAR